MVIDMHSCSNRIAACGNSEIVSEKRKSKSVKALWKAFSEQLIVWQRDSRSRRELQSLNAYQLKDIGLSRADTLSDAAKPFWK